MQLLDGVVAVLHRYLSRDRVLPSRENTIACSCLRALTRLTLARKPSSADNRRCAGRCQRCP